MTTIDYTCENCRRSISVVIHNPPIASDLDPVYVEPYHSVAARLMRHRKPAPIRVCRQCAEAGWRGKTVDAPEAE